MNTPLITGRVSPAELIGNPYIIHLMTDEEISELRHYCFTHFRVEHCRAALQIIDSMPSY